MSIRICIAALLIAAAPAAAAGRVKDSAQLRAAVAKAQPGSVITLQAGTYEPGLRVVGLAGTQRRPIVIEGDDAVFRGGSCAIHLVECRYVTLRRLTVEGCSGNGINIDDGGSTDTPSHHIVLEGITVLDTGPKGNHDGIKLSGVEDFVVRGCRIAGWGGSAIDMVGCHRGVVDDCTFEGKQGFSQSNGVQMKGGSRKILVHGCFFRNAGQRSINLGGSTGLKYFRPQDARFEAEEVTVAGNRFTGSDAFIAFVNASGARVHHNTMHAPNKWVLRILQETTNERFPPCREGVFEHNLIVCDHRVRTAVNVGPGTAPKTFVFRGNAWFGAAPPRLPAEETGGVYGIDPHLADAGTPKMRATSKDQRLRTMGARAYERSPGR
jgi:hypothetical protein